MARYRIRYGLGGGFGGCCEWEEIDAPNDEAASVAAWEAACEEYESYDGLHGLRSVSDIMKEDGLDSDEAHEAWEEERESWIDYESERIE